MNSNKRTARSLEDVKINVKFKLSALWVAVMLCYIYCDFFSLLEPGHIEEIIAGKMAIGPTTQGKLLGAAILMAIPAAMVFLSLTLKPKVNRWVNIILGVIYTVIMLIIVLRGSWAYYIFLGIVEMGLTALIVWHAWRWPNQSNLGRDS